jgi:hypothetical protein
MSRIAPRGLASSYDVISKGELAVGAAVVRLTATPTPCALVWIGAPTANHTVGELNTTPILIGDSASSNAAGGMTLEASNHLGFFLPINDASKIYLQGFTAGDVIEYQIWGN